MYRKESVGVDAALELDHLSLPLLVSSQLEVLGPLEGDLHAPLARRALHAEDDLLGGLGLEEGEGKAGEELGTATGNEELERHSTALLLLNPEVRNTLKGKLK